MKTITRNTLSIYILEALSASGGSSNIQAIAKSIWDTHEQDLKDSGPMFYQWQYEMRWAARNLRKQGVLAEADFSNKGVWTLKQSVENV